jgi:hypothetical protein
MSSGARFIKELATKTKNLSWFLKFAKSMIIENSYTKKYISKFSLNRFKPF